MSEYACATPGVGGVPRRRTQRPVLNATSPASMHVTSAGVKLVHANLSGCLLFTRYCVGEGDGHLVRAGGCICVMKRELGRPGARRGELIAARVRVIDLNSDEASALRRDVERDRVPRRCNAFVRG